MAIRVYGICVYDGKFMTRLECFNGMYKQHTLGCTQHIKQAAVVTSVLAQSLSMRT